MFVVFTSVYLEIRLTQEANFFTDNHNDCEIKKTSNEVAKLSRS